MIPFTPQFLKLINKGKSYDNQMNVANLIKKFEYMMAEYIRKKKTKKEKAFYFTIPKEYNSVKKEFLENIVYNLENEGFRYNESIESIESIESNITRGYSFYTSYLQYTKIVNVNSKLVAEYNYESPLYVEYGSLENAIGIKIWI